MLKYNLSNRMAAVAHLVPKGTIVCDIGCDHGFVAIWLVEKKVCPKVIAMDINAGPLLRAEEHIESAGLSAYIETRLSDGLEKLYCGEAGCMIAAGMGGRLIGKIMEDCPEKLRSLRYLVLQPQSEIAFVRRLLREKGYVIRKEDMVFEDGKFYPMMLAEAAAGKMQNDENTDAASEQRKYRESLADEFGPCLLKENHPVLRRYLDWWEKQQNKILNQVLTCRERRAQVEEELTRIRDARSVMENGRGEHR